MSAEVRREEHGENAVIAITIPVKEVVLSSIIGHVQIAIPVSCTFVMKRSVDLIAVIFVGHLGSSYLSSAGLASVTANVTGYSMIIGLAGALTSLASHAFGAKDMKELGLLLQRSLLIICLCVCIPVSLLWWNSEVILSFLGQDKEIASMASAYLRYLLPGLWARACSVCIQNWLYAQAHTTPMLVVTATTALINPALCYLLIFQWGYGYLGAAIAVSSIKVLELVVITGYLVLFSKETIRITNLCSFSSWEHACYRDWMPILRLGLPNLLMMSEWWASEIIIFLSGTLPNPHIQISTMSIYQNILSLCYMIPSGLQVSASTLVGNGLGAGDVEAARYAAYTAPVLALCVTSVIALLLLLLRHECCRLFTNDTAVKRLVISLMPVLMSYVVADGVTTTFSGIIKGMGKQRSAGPVVLIAYYVVGIPVAVLLAFGRGVGFDMGIVGLCIGTLVGTVTHLLLFIWIVLYRTNWEIEALKISKRNQRIAFLSAPSTRRAFGDDTATSELYEDFEADNEDENVYNLFGGALFFGKRGKQMPNSDESSGNGNSRNNRNRRRSRMGDGIVGRPGDIYIPASATENNNNNNNNNSTDDDHDEEGLNFRSGGGVSPVGAIGQNRRRRTTNTFPPNLPSTSSPPSTLFSQLLSAVGIGAGGGGLATFFNLSSSQAAEYELVRTFTETFGEHSVDDTDDDRDADEDFTARPRYNDHRYYYSDQNGGISSSGSTSSSGIGGSDGSGSKDTVTTKVDNATAIASIDNTAGSSQREGGSCSEEYSDCQEQLQQQQQQQQQQHCEEEKEEQLQRNGIETAVKSPLYATRNIREGV